MKNTLPQWFSSNLSLPHWTRPTSATNSCFNRLFALVGLGLCTLTVPARAVIINLGLYDPPPGGESAANELAFLNTTVLPTYNAANNPDLPLATFGTDNINGTGTSITLDISDYSYIKLKWDGMWQFYSIIGETDTSHTFNSTVFNQAGQPQALSHYTFFGPDDSSDVPPPGVPDGGSAVLLLGLGMGSLVLFRRYFHA